LLTPLLLAGLLAGCGRPSVAPTAAPKSASEPAPAVRSDKEQVLDAIVRHVLESDFLKDLRADYGTPGDKRVALVANTDNGVPWPKDYQPAALKGYEVLRVAEIGGAADQPRMLGIRIDKLDLSQKETELFREPIVISVMNAGGRKNGDTSLGCSVYYIPARKADGWLVEATRLYHP